MPAAWGPPDLDESRPDLFLVNNEKVRPFLRGEGDLAGKLFHLRSQRREGWIGRLRMAGFNVRTLQDRVEALPSVAPGVVPGPEFDRPLTSARERIGTWDARQLRWRDLPEQTVGGQRTVRLRLNEVIRRRKSRGEGDYFVVMGTAPGHINLRPIGETNALMHAYAMMAALGQSPRVALHSAPDGLFVPSSLGILPDPHRQALDRLASADAAAWTFGPAQMPLVEEVFARLALPLDRPPV